MLHKIQSLNYFDLVKGNSCTKTKDKRCEQFLYNFRTYIYAIMLNRPLLDEIYVTPLAILYEVEPMNPFSIIQFSRPSPLAQWD